MQPWIRKYNYIADYYNTAYNLYSKLYPAFPVTYYSIDWDYTKDHYDKKLMAGSYEKYGIGALSGFRFKKIQMLPAYNVESIQPIYNGDEKGLTLKDAEFGSISFPTTYGLKPNEYDIIHFSQDFMMETIDFKPIFVVRNTELATYGDINLYKLSLKVSSSTLLDLEQQISDRFMFLEFTKQIHDIRTAAILLNLQQKNETLDSKFYEMTNPLGLYIQKTSI